MHSTITFRDILFVSPGKVRIDTELYGCRENKTSTGDDSFFYSLNVTVYHCHTRYTHNTILSNFKTVLSVKNAHPKIIISTIHMSNPNLHVTRADTRERFNNMIAFFFKYILSCIESFELFDKVSLWVPVIETSIPTYRHSTNLNDSKHPIHFNTKQINVSIHLLLANNLDNHV